MITVLREGKILRYDTIRKDKPFVGLEVVVYVGGVALGQPATSIPLAAIIGLIAGLAVGLIVYQFARRSSKLFPNCAEAALNQRMHQ